MDEKLVKLMNKIEILGNYTDEKYYLGKLLNVYCLYTNYLDNEDINKLINVIEKNLEIIKITTNNDLLYIKAKNKSDANFTNEYLSFSGTKVGYTGSERCNDIYIEMTEILLDKLKDIKDVIL